MKRLWILDVTGKTVLSIDKGLVEAERPEHITSAAADVSHV
jgi:hypothetical protein